MLNFLFSCLLFDKIIFYLSTELCISHTINHFVKRVLVLSLNIKRKPLGRKKKAK